MAAGFCAAGRFACRLYQKAAFPAGQIFPGCIDPVTAGAGLTAILIRLPVGSRGWHRRTRVCLRMVIFAIGLPLILVLTVSIGIRLFWKVRAKGYRGPVPGILFAVATPVPVLGMAVVDAAADRHLLGGFKQALLMLAAFGLLSFVIVIIAALVVRWLPVQRPKVRRRVRAPYRTFGVLVAMATPVVAVLDTRNGSR